MVSVVCSRQVIHNSRASGKRAVCELCERFVQGRQSWSQGMVENSIDTGRIGDQTLFISTNKQ